MLLFDSDVVAAWTFTTGSVVTGGIKLFASTEDVLDVFPDEAISASAAIRFLHYAARNGCELIKGEFGVGHLLRLWVFPSL